MQTKVVERQLQEASIKLRGLAQMDCVEQTYISHLACSSPASLGTGTQPVIHAVQAPVVVASPTGHCTQSL
jgi:hypothetical protein